MGANFITMTVPGDKSRAEVTQAFEDRQRSDGWESGHSYSGSFSQFPGLEFSRWVFPSQDAAQTWLCDNTQKWEEAKAVRYRHIDVTQVKAPTFDGKPAEHYFAYNSPVYVTDYTGATTKTVLPDQLTAAQVKRLMRSIDAHARATTAHQKAEARFQGLLRVLTDTENPVDYTALRQARTAYLRAKKQHVKVAAAHQKLIDQLHASLYRTKQVDKGEHWMIGGWSSC